MLLGDSPLLSDSPRVTVNQLAAIAPPNASKRGARESVPPALKWAAITAPTHDIVACTIAFMMIRLAPRRATPTEHASPTVVASSGFRRSAAAPDAMAV